MTVTYTITLHANGKQFAARDDETILDAALRAGYVLPYSCRTGSCGTCKARLISGEVDYGEYQAQAMDEQERATGGVLLCRAKPLGDVTVEAREVVAAEGIEIRILPCRVARMEILSEDVMRLMLTLPKNQAFTYLPGQYIDVLLNGGRRRSFSIANRCADTGGLELHIRRIAGGVFSDQVFTRLKERDLLRFQGPLGTFFIREESTRPILLLAGGTGFAPIKAIIEHAIASGMSRSMHLFWGARTRRDLYLRELAESWAMSNGLFKFTPVLSEPSAEEDWSGAVGLVHQALLECYPDLSEYEIYASGPPPMIEAGKSEFAKRGLPALHYYFDSFEFASDPIPAACPPATAR